VVYKKVNVLVTNKIKWWLKWHLLGNKTDFCMYSKKQ